MKTLKVSSLKMSAVLPFLCIAFTSFGQNTILTDAQVWLSPSPSNSPLTSSYIGNYPVLDLNDFAIEKAFTIIGKEEFGTLFLVGDFPDGEGLITFGNISISNAETRVGQATLTYDS